MASGELIPEVLKHLSFQLGGRGGGISAPLDQGRRSQGSQYDMNCLHWG